MTVLNIHAVDIDGKTITSVTLREPTGADMIGLAEHLPALIAFAAEQEAAAAGGAATFPGPDVIRAMIATASATTGLGAEAAGKLAFSDISRIVMASQDFLGRAMSVEQTNGASRPASSVPN